MTRVAFVSGGAQGIGRAIVERLAADGVTVVIGDIQAEAARKTAEEIAARGAEAIALPVDIADEQSVKEAYAEIEQRFGRLDILVNNAAILVRQGNERPPVEAMLLDTWEKSLRVNLTGTFLMCRAAVPMMRRGRYGRIVNITSLAARARTGLNNANYATSKATLIGLSRGLASEVGEDGITVNCVAPSRTPTPMTLAASGGDMKYFQASANESPVGRVAEPADVANAVAYLTSEGASFVTGAIIDVTGGYFMP